MTPEELQIELMKRMAFRRQIRATLALYKDRDKTPKGIKYEMERMLQEQTEKNERELRRIDIEMKRLKSEESQQRSIRIHGSKARVTIAPAVLPRKLDLEDL